LITVLLIIYFISSNLTLPTLSSNLIQTVHRPNCSKLSMLFHHAIPTFEKGWGGWGDGGMGVWGGGQNPPPQPNCISSIHFPLFSYPSISSPTIFLSTQNSFTFYYSAYTFYALYHICTVSCIAENTLHKIKCINTIHPTHHQTKICNLFA
jgi:hypothetical protein